MNEQRPRIAGQIGLLIVSAILNTPLANAAPAVDLPSKNQCLRRALEASKQIESDHIKDRALIMLIRECALSEEGHLHACKAYNHLEPLLNEDWLPDLARRAVARAFILDTRGTLEDIDRLVTEEYIHQEELLPDISRIFLNAGETDAALAVIKRLSAKSPSRGSLLYRAANQLKKQGSITQASILKGAAMKSALNVELVSVSRSAIAIAEDLDKASYRDEASDILCLAADRIVAAEEYSERLWHLNDILWLLVHKWNQTERAKPYVEQAYKLARNREIRWEYKELSRLATFLLDCGNIENAKRVARMADVNRSGIEASVAARLIKDGELKAALALAANIDNYYNDQDQAYTYIVDELMRAKRFELVIDITMLSPSLERRALVLLGLIQNEAPPNLQRAAIDRAWEAANQISDNEEKTATMGLLVPYMIEIGESEKARQASGISVNTAIKDFAKFVENNKGRYHDSSYNYHLNAASQAIADALLRHAQIGYADEVLTYIEGPLAKLELAPSVAATFPAALAVHFHKGGDEEQSRHLISLAMENAKQVKVGHSGDLFEYCRAHAYLQIKRSLQRGKLPAPSKIDEKIFLNLVGYLPTAAHDWDSFDDTHTIFAEIIESCVKNKDVALLMLLGEKISDFSLDQQACIWMELAGASSRRTENGLLKAKANDVE